MIDRKARVSDNWRNVRDRKKYQYLIQSIQIAENDFTEEINIEINSGLTSLCGRNGAGKSSLLYSIYRALTRNDEPHSFRDISSKIKIFDQNSKKLSEYGESEVIFECCELIDPSYEAMVNKKAIIADTTFIEDYANEGVESDLLDKYLGYIRKILSKEITSISVVEVEGKLEDSQILPYIRINKNGQLYDNLCMGQGEHKVLYLIWRLAIAQKNSIILLEEPEAFLCSKSQEYLMDVIVCIAHEKKLHVILSTHSDLVMKNQSVSSCSIVKLNSRDKITLIKENSKSKYLSALGLTPPKKGVFLVEDRFAKIKLNEIFNRYSSTLKNEYHIDILDGESHILEVAKHYASKNIHVVPVLDGDMVGKLAVDDYLIALTFLPNINQLPPEPEVIDYIKGHIPRFASTIPHDTEKSIEAINSVFANYHDWFDELNGELDFGDKSHLERIAIQFWLDEYKAPVERFLILLETLTEKLTSVICYDSQYFVQLKGHHFYASKDSCRKYNLDNYVGKPVRYTLHCQDNEIFSKIEIT
ncbi:AAA family ATPase [Alteromonas sp. W364]|uniref:ATP-dependent nuclease n=1 Tax=Alteromonas sp. W364 TaxID=3075610 RepID=UPI0028880C0A|nr:AAA family ATPase [Alteromonas sp. W364]MDT0628074.1 AAA family ATPase [Alteromonas sp. W364]